MIQMLKNFKIVIIVSFVLIIVALLILLDCFGVSYIISTSDIEEIPQSVINDKTDKEKIPKTCLLLRDSTQENNDIFTNHITDTLEIMRVGYDLVDVSDNDIPSFSDYKTVVIGFQNLEVLGNKVGEMCSWVENEGGGVMFYCTPDSSPVFRFLAPYLGIEEGGVSYITIEGITLADGFMLGGDGFTLHWDEPMPTALSVRLSSRAEVFAYSDDNNVLPLVWRSNYGKGAFVVNNHGFTDKASRGLISAAYSLLQDVSIHPVINASSFFLDDFPSPVPMGDGQYIREEYGRDISSFYSSVWWPDMLNLCDNFGIKYTGVVIEDYSDEVDGIFLRQTDVERFKYFGSMLLDNGGEIGIHGYNHQPICFTGFKYEEGMDYNSWPNQESVINAFSEVKSFIGDLFPDASPSVYVPPSNVLSDEGRAMFRENFPYIKTICSLYLESETGYSQEFEIAEDGIVEFPRVISGAVLDQYMYWDAIGCLNLYYVNSHFIHPDDVLDVDRGAELGWSQLYENLYNYMDWLYSSVPNIRNMTGTEASRATQRYDVLTFESSEDEDGNITLRLDGLWDEAYLMMRFNNGAPGEITGGELEHISGDIYILRATSDLIKIETVQ